jgi:hypothetical protein
MPSRVIIASVASASSDSKDNFKEVSRGVELLFNFMEPINFRHDTRSFGSDFDPDLKA